MIYISYSKVHRHRVVNFYGLSLKGVDSNYSIGPLYYIGQAGITRVSLSLSYSEFHILLGDLIIYFDQYLLNNISNFYFSLFTYLFMITCVVTKNYVDGDFMTKKLNGRTTTTKISFVENMA